MFLKCHFCANFNAECDVHIHLTGNVWERAYSDDFDKEVKFEALGVYMPMVLKGYSKG